MKNQRGFTLIELLVVIAILAVLFGVTALALNGVGSNAKRAAACGEQDVVQTAIDIYVNKDNGTMAAQATAVKVSAGGPTFTQYLRRDTKFCYTWDATGRITNIYDASGSTCSGTVLTCP